MPAPTVPAPIAAADRTTRTVVARAPGKVILSGEHAVVYGQPAVVMAVNRHVTTTITAPADAPAGITFDLPELGQCRTYAAAELLALAADVQTRYAAFTAGTLPIAQVLPQAYELLPVAFARVAHHLPSTRLTGLWVRVHMTIPLGCGMGSSAAASLSMLGAAATWLDVPAAADDFYAWGLACEQLRHGRPSGVDVRVCLNGGAMRFQQGRSATAPLPPWPLYFVNTGTPRASTGECVMHVATHHRDRQELWAEFGAVTTAIARAVATGDLPAFRAGVRANHRLLCMIGVTPDHVRTFVARVEGQGGAAKICGAGEVGNGGGGVVLVSSAAPPADLCREFGYELLDLQGEPHGLHVV